MSDQENHQNLLSKQYIDTLVASDDATIRATDLKNTEKFSKKIFSLPNYPTLDEVKVTKIINILNKI